MPASPGPASAVAYSVPAVERAARVFAHLKRHPQSTLTDVASALGIGVSSCYAILKTLERHDLVAFDPRAKTYRLGLALLELGGAVGSDLASVHKARPQIADYTRRTGLTTFVVSRASREHLLVVDKEEPEGGLRISIAVGTRFRITDGLSGRCFMAFLPPQESESLLDAVGLHPHAGEPPPGMAAYRRQLRESREVGYVAVSDSASSANNGVAAPIFDREGRILFCLTAMGLGPALGSKSIRDTGSRLRRSADMVTRKLRDG